MDSLQDGTVAMDYTRHKLERHVRRQSEQGIEDQGDETNRDTRQDDLERSGATRRSSSISGSDLSPTTQRPRSILKSPTVRFKVNDDTEKVQEFTPPMFPPHPGLQPALHDKMPPLPPGPPRGLNPFESVPGPGGVPRIDPAAYALYTKFMDELEEFVSMQGNVINARVRVQERRTRLRLYRENVSRRDIEYMDYLRECKANGTIADDPKLEELFDAARIARDEVGPEEVDYEQLEIRLGADEFALKEKYDSLESRFENFFRLRATSTTNMTIPSTIEFETASLESSHDKLQITEQEPRQYALFQGSFIGDKVKVGQHPLVRNDANAEEPAAHVTISRTNEGPPSGPQVSSDAQVTGRVNASIISNSPGDDGPVPPQDHLDREPERMEPFSSGSLPEFESGEARIKFSLRDLDLPSIEEAAENLLEDLDVDYSFGDGNSLLLLGTDSDTQSTLSDYLMQFDSTRSRVNRWLLHKLRVSPLEVFELRREVLESSHPPDWANLALTLWEGDDTELDGFGRRLERTPAPYPSTRDLPRRHRWRRKVRSSTVMKEAGLTTVPDTDDVLVGFDLPVGGLV